MGTELASGQKTSGGVAEPDADSFRVGDVWQNSAGSTFKVLRVERRVAHMVNERTGRTHSRAWDAIGAHTGRPWVRLEWGAGSKPG